MDVLEKFQAAPNDFLACRKTNTAPKLRADYGLLALIENEGLSLESLDKLKLPVYKYQTQVTLHGLWPETQGYCGGYKQLVTNKNQSIGIRYNAIDSAKKIELVKKSRYSKMVGFRNSTETFFYINCRKHYKLACNVKKQLEQYCNLFLGNIRLVQDKMFSGYFYVIVTLSAIPEKNTLLFAEKILKVTDAKIAKKENERAERELRHKKEQAAIDLNNENHKKQAESVILANGLKPIEHKKKTDYRAYYPSYSVNKNCPLFCVIEVKSAAFGSRYKWNCFLDLETAKSYVFDWSTKKAKKFDLYDKKLYA